MDSFLIHNNRNEFLEVVKGISKSKLMERMEGNKKPIRVHIKTKSSLIYHELNPSKEKTQKIMNNYFKTIKTKRDFSNELSSNKEYNDYTIVNNNNKILNPEISQNVFSQRPNISYIKKSSLKNKENNNKINDNNNKKNRNIEEKKNNEQISRRVSFNSEINDNSKRNHSNKSSNNLEITNSIISDNNTNVNNINNYYNINIIHDLNKNKLISPLASFHNSNKGKVSIRNNIISKNFNCPEEKDIFKQHKNKTFSNINVNSEPVSYRINDNNNENIFKREIKNIQKKNLSNPNLMELEKNNNKMNTIIKIEDLIYLEEKLKNILNNFDNLEELKRLCVEWYNFYYYSSFYNVFKNFSLSNSKKLEEKNIGHEYSVLEFLSIIVIHEVINDVNISQSTINCLNKLMSLVYQNFLIICDFFVSVIPFYCKNTLWVKKLQSIIMKNREIEISNNHFNLLKNGCKSIAILIKNILKFYNNNSNFVNGNELTFFLRRSSRILINTLNEYFKKKINYEDEKSKDCKNREKNNMIDISSIINNKNLSNQNFTLILELNETIISIKKDNKGKVIIIPRPGLTQFLKEISKLYEIIIFTTFDKNYADQIINSIDKKNRYFEKRLYKEHTIFINNIYIKDLSQLKRDLSKVIIIDNKPQNFELQKENGIYIRSFNGNKNDNVLLDLINILKKIACNNENDVRNEIKKLYNEIFSKITTDLNERTN